MTTERKRGLLTFRAWEKRFDRPYLWMLVAVILFVAIAIAGGLLGW